MEIRYESYAPNERQALFHAIRPVGPTLIKGYIGGLGSGKSTACYQEQAMICMKTPGGKSVAVRSTMTRADTSLIDDYRNLLSPRHARFYAADYCVFRNGHRLYFAPGDDWNRFGSFDIVSFYIQEAHEADWEIFDALTQRLRHPAGMVRRPDGQIVPWYRGLFCARGVLREHWIHKQYVGDSSDPIAWSVDMPEEKRMKVRIPAWTWVRAKTSDNLMHLPVGYEDQQRAQYPHNIAWQKLMLEGEFGFDVGGVPVYGDYDPEIHDAIDLPVDEGLPIMRGWDFGYNSPAVVFCQLSRYGAVHVLDEITPRETSVWELVDDVKALQQARWPHRHAGEYQDFGDIAGEQENSVGLTEIEAVEKALATTIDYRTHRIRDGIAMIRKLMTRRRRIKGGASAPLFRIDKRCEKLREALGGAYYYKSMKTDERPVKGNGYDDVADALRYVVINALDYNEEPEEPKEPQYPRKAEFGGFPRLGGY